MCVPDVVSLIVASNPAVVFQVGLAFTLNASSKVDDKPEAFVT